MIQSSRTNTVTSSPFAVVVEPAAALRGPRNNDSGGGHMEKYRLVQEHKAEESEDFLGTQTSGNLPEVRITQKGKPRNYISYAMNLFVRPS